MLSRPPPGGSCATNRPAGVPPRPRISDSERHSPAAEAESGDGRLSPGTGLGRCDAPVALVAGRLGHHRLGAGGVPHLLHHAVAHLSRLLHRGAASLPLRMGLGGSCPGATSHSVRLAARDAGLSSKGRCPASERRSRPQPRRRPVRHRDGARAHRPGGDRPVLGGRCALPLRPAGVGGIVRHRGHDDGLPQPLRQGGAGARRACTWPPSSSTSYGSARTSIAPMLAREESG